MTAFNPLPLINSDDEALPAKYNQLIASQKLSSPELEEPVPLAQAITLSSPELEEPVPSDAPSGFMTAINLIPIISTNTGLSATGPVALLTAGPDTGQNDLVPALHLPRWATTGVKVVNITGDSTGTETVSGVYAYDGMQTIWGALKTEIVRRNPSPQKRFVFNNKAIASSNWAWLTQSANQIGIIAPLPAWYVDRDKVWLDYIRDDYPDTLFIVMGTNAPSSGQVAGSSVASYINDVFTQINGWMKVPDIILLTTKIGNPAAGPPYSTDQEAYKAMMSFLRTFARSNRNGYGAFPRIGYIGLIDLGRQYAARAYGKDFALQYFSRVPSAIRNGLTLVGPFATTFTTLGTTTDGDLSMTLVFRGAGGTAMYNALGAGGFYVGCTGFVANRIQITLGGTGVWATHYQFTGVNSDPSISGTAYSPPSGDVTFSVVLKSEVLRVAINGVYVMDTVAPRLIQNCPITIGAGSTPTGSITFDVTEFLEGIGAPVMQTLDPTTAFGAAGSPTSGNDINHPSSITSALIDFQTIAASNLAAPQPTDDQIEEDAVKQIYNDPTSTPNTAVLIEEVLKTYDVNPNQLLNIGDVLEVKAFGTLAATTDNKSPFIRWGGLTGAIVASPFTIATTGNRWRIIGTITKTGSNLQQVDGQGVISNTNFATNCIAAAVADTAQTTIVVTSKNITNAVAGSITCDGFSVTYKKAPGT